MRLSPASRGGIAALIALLTPATGAGDHGFRVVQRFKAEEAHQAVAVDRDAFYAITNRAIGRYDKRTGQRVKSWSAADDSPIRHLNSGVVVGDRLYCAHSNWPQLPRRNTIEVFRVPQLKHLQTRPLAETEGAVNWIERQGDAWWVVFGHYAADVARTRLVRLDDDWQPSAEWTFPRQVTQRFLPYSNSGGAFGPGGELYVTGHDHAELYVLAVPPTPGELKYLQTLPAGLAGQGIAWDDHLPGRLYGIVRKSREVVVLERHDD